MQLYNEDYTEKNCSKLDFPLSPISHTCKTPDRMLEIMIFKTKPNAT